LKDKLKDRNRKNWRNAEGRRFTASGGLKNPEREKWIPFGTVSNRSNEKRRGKGERGREKRLIKEGFVH